MNDSDFEDAPNRLCKNGEGTVTPTRRMQLLTEEQEWKAAELLARQKQEHDSLLKHPVETRQREELIQEARKAAQRAIRESGPGPQAEREAAADGWRNMWIALVVIGAILFLLRLRF
jgi:hypothetical protein